MTMTRNKNEYEDESDEEGSIRWQIYLSLEGNWKKFKAEEDCHEDKEEDLTPEERTGGIEEQQRKSGYDIELETIGK